MPDAHDGAVTCEDCGKKYRWQAKFAGKKVRCQCGHKLVMPDSQPGQDEGIIPLAIDEAELNAPAPRPRKSAPADSQQPALPVSAFAIATAGTPADPANKGYCPSCKAAVKPTAVICVACGYNLQENKALTTQTGGKVRASTGPVSGPRRSYASDGQDGFFARLSRSWEMIKISYGILWDFKQLIVFPILSAIAAILVTLSLVFPAIGAHEAIQAAGVEGTGELTPHMEKAAYAVVGLVFYFCNYFVIVFFNTALAACTMKVTAGEAPTLGYGLSVAVKRLPQIAAWALLSAVVGQAIKMLESNKTIGKIMAVVLGTGWAIITYFVVPVLCVEGVGPFKAVKRSFVTIKETWGESLLGNTAIGVINFLLSLPFIVLIAVGVLLLIGDQATLGLLILIVSGIGLLVFMAASSAADGVFRALLYNYATGRSLPADVDEDLFGAVFANKPFDS